MTAWIVTESSVVTSNEEKLALKTHLKCGKIIESKWYNVKRSDSDYSYKMNITISKVVWYGIRVYRNMENKPEYYKISDCFTFSGAENTKKRIIKKVTNGIDLDIPYIDIKMAETSNIKIGDILHVKRKLGTYEHAGIYIGESKVVHISKDNNGTFRPAIGRLTQDFIQNCPLRIMYPLIPIKTPNEIVNECLLAVKEQRMPSSEKVGNFIYNLFTRNCQHFVTDAVMNNPKSTTVQEYSTGFTLGAFGAAMVALVSFVLTNSDDED